MNIKEVDNKNFEEIVLKSEKPVLVDFNADWCGPCRMLRPIIEDLSNERDDIVFASINIDSEDQIATNYEVFSIPCLVLFKDGKEIKRSVGMKPKEEIELFLGDL